MSLVSPSQSNPGDEITAARINNPINQLAAQINGNIDSTNIAASGVGSTQLATGAVTGAAIATSAITLGYAQSTTSFSSSSTAPVQVTGLTVTVTVPAGGRRVKITAYVGAPYNATPSGSLNLSIWDGTVGSGTQLANSAHEATNNTGIQAHNLIAMAVVTPSAGSKTYNVAMNSSTGTFSTNVAATAPAFILVEAI